MAAKTTGDRHAVSVTDKRARTQKTIPDWGSEAKNGDHLWCRTSASGDLCYLPDNMCARHGHRVKCSACKVIIHVECIPGLIGQLKVFCKTTFQDSGIRMYRERIDVNHHWVARKCEKGKCQACGRSFQSKLFGGKETIAMMCSWCKVLYHYKESCFNQEKMTTENCPLGVHANAIVPPTWIVKLPLKGTFRSSLRKNATNERVENSNDNQEIENSKQDFVIKPIPSSSSKPILIFINPKSGGNQGNKLMRIFQWLLNPRQVFDLSEGGPKCGLELYRKVPNLRILACGGDGTVGWILSILDDLKVSPSPPVAVLPLGTGNDLARALGWGGGYTDEPMSKILTNIGDGEIVKLDRWSLKVEPNTSEDLSNCDGGRKSLTLNVVNNYFSLGVDALIALEFHEAREARPDKFNSRFRNKMFYGQAGGKDLLKRKWKDLSNRVTLECDGQDITHKIKELKIHALLFLNIPSYGGGTRPWGTPGNPFVPQSTDDGMIEVVGLTTYQLPLLQAGGHGTPITQCRQAKITTSCTIPVQVDGEPCRLLPSVIELKLLNTVNMVAKTKRHGNPRKEESIEKLQLQIKRLNIVDYESHHHDKESLLEKAIVLGTLNVSFDMDLSEVRTQVNVLIQETSAETKEIDSRAEQDAQNRGQPIQKIAAAPPAATTKDEKAVQAQDKISVLKENESQAPEEKDNTTNEEKEKLVSEEDEEAVVTEEESSEWWFLDSCTAERFFRIDHAQEHLYYVADICDSELYILHPSVHVEADSAVALEEVILDSDEGSRESTSSSEPAPASGDYSHLVEPSEAPEEDLMAAAKMGHLETVVRLHASGHDLTQKDHEGRTALHHAAFIGNTAVVKYLAFYGPPELIDMADDIMYHTALHRAATRGDRTVCSILVCAGCSLHIKDKQGMTAQQLASFVGDEKLAAYLQMMKDPVVV